LEISAQFVGKLEKIFVKEMVTVIFHEK
jgi:hypothetical protein